MAGGKGVQCVVVTPERAVLDVRADAVSLPMYDGGLGVLPGRAPLIGRLGAGGLRIRIGNETQVLFVDGGFAQVRGDVVTVLTSRARKQEEVSQEEARKALEAATAALKKAKGEEAQDELLAAQEKARALLRVAAQRPRG
jgi:F-type H+-transporting ATPase subunit epsilon